MVIVREVVIICDICKDKILEAEFSANIHVKTMNEKDGIPLISMNYLFHDICKDCYSSVREIIHTFHESLNSYKRDREQKV